VGIVAALIYVFIGRGSLPGSIQPSALKKFDISAGADDEPDSGEPEVTEDGVPEEPKQSMGEPEP
jgi:hypothetical protein